MTALVLWWYDPELNIHWNAAADSVVAFRLAIDIASELGGGANSVSYRVKAPWEAFAPVVQAAPEVAAAAIDDLWRSETQFEGSLTANESQYEISAVAEGDGGQLSLESSQGVFGARFDDLVGMLRRYANERNIRISAPLQRLSFGRSF